MDGHDARGIAAERVLQACASCARVIDVSGLALGTKIRCACSALSSVAPPAPMSLRTLKCGRCGGAFQDSASTCPWCSATIVLADRKLAGLCGRCSARLDRDARFCPGCGTAIHDQVVRPLPEQTGCPSCGAHLAHRRVGEREFIECSSCGGLWIDASGFEALCAHSEANGTLKRMLSMQPARSKTTDRERVAYVKCVTCGDFMFRKNLGPGSGLILDVCKDHGVWFDHGELVRALDFAERGGLARAREAEKRRQDAERARREALTNDRKVEPREFGGSPTTPFEDALVDTIADAVGALARIVFGRYR